MNAAPIRLGEADIAAAIRLRRALHAHPELSGAEVGTAAAVTAALRRAGADAFVTGLGGHGVAALFEGRAPGPSVMIRAELDALPITEESAAPHRSTMRGRGHLCGHDGHMAILHAVALTLGRQRPAGGRVIVLFQPAEEDGTGAAALLADPRLRALAPDWIFALHNLPGLALGHAALADGLIACASRGMRIRLAGWVAHASQPETGLSPRAAVARLLDGLPALASAAPFPDPAFRVVTITHAAMGVPAFGIAPGSAEIWATLRSLSDEAMAELVAGAERLVRDAARAEGLGCEIEHADVFDSCRNHPAAVAHLRAAMDDLGLPHGPDGQPWRPSEDFGRLGTLAPAAMLFLGSGADQPPLHDPGFDFPDRLIAPGARIFLRVIERICAPV